VAITESLKSWRFSNRSNKEDMVDRRRNFAPMTRMFLPLVFFAPKARQFRTNRHEAT
jgi:hypothetical protein